jgi:hypothetical protein
MGRLALLWLIPGGTPKPKYGAQTILRSEAHETAGYKTPAMVYRDGKLECPVVVDSAERLEITATENFRLTRSSAK